MGLELCPSCGRPIDPKAPCGCRPSEALRTPDVSLELDRPAARSVAPPALVAPSRVAIASGRPPPMPSAQRSLPPPRTGASASSIAVLVKLAFGLLVAAVIAFGVWWRTHISDDVLVREHTAPNGMLRAKYPEDFEIEVGIERFLVLSRRAHPGESIYLWAPAATHAEGAIVAGPDRQTLDEATQVATKVISRARKLELQLEPPTPGTCQKDAEESQIARGHLGELDLWTCAFRHDGVVYLYAYTVPPAVRAMEGPRLETIAGRTSLLSLKHCTHLDSGYLCPPP